ncbi:MULTISPECIES: alpha-L-fucosidase [Paenibacillus]|uniref:alpha-L-fucosidase n=1 Tax=Paenibacillus campinasensis TaxID=66347 RepID=A0ABW9T341_9BACL|nr:MULTISPECIES: alpha-L-fucosidase [Paenibacillus]MUG65646.1 alpha-L-fucosidase [Paenibacillus campinasensis]PAK54301.1 alpha-L-fucosidase [Paenibacillus sp. 7541]
MTNHTNPIIQERKERVQWFEQDRFGMFIHWGLYAIPARGEWIRSTEKMSIQQYQTYYDEFNPVHYNPREWAKAAKEAGMKYAVLTAKHHDGFCLFDSKLTDYKSTNTQAGRDLVREFLEAFREEGLKVGLYYSLIDWHHEDYPAYGDRIHPMRENEAFKRDPNTFGRYLDYMHGQVRELLTDYGKLDLMWFDFSYDEMTGEKWRATELVQMIRELQPHILIDNRLEGSGEQGGSIYTANPSIYSGDFASPEQIIPPRGLVNELGDPIPWEACITLNNNWGYAAADRNYKSATTIIRKLVECVSKNGNMLLNVGPDAKGAIPQESLDILKEIGDWMKKNGDSIHGCRAADFPKPEWGRYTQKGNKLYAHLFEESIGPISLPGLADKIKSARLLADGSEVFVGRPWSAAEFIEDAFISFARPEHFTYPLPDKRNTVIELELII